MAEKEPNRKKKIAGWIIFAVTAVVIFLLGIFAASIIERRSESAVRLQIVKNIGQWEPRNEVWGENFPNEYETYIRTLDTNFASRYGGSAFRDYLRDNPELIIMWAGYGFSKAYYQGRGHAHAIEDIRHIFRSGGLKDNPTPATCWTCKSTDVPRLMNQMGVAGFYKGKWIEIGDQIANPIGCQDCHDPKTMNLRITRPALIEALRRQGKKVEDFTHNEMRSLVCAQCHVEYYFKKEGNYLTFPWDRGMTADSMEAYYENIKFSDWTNKLSRAPMLKAQHPDYELYLTGVHASRGVSCADCHMPYKVIGGIKITDHHVQSPLNNIANSCQVCHRESEEKLRNDVNSRQDKVMEVRRIAEKSISSAHLEAKMAWDNGATDQEMAPVLQLLRSAQWRWDWVAAANSVGFHSPVEALRVLATSIERSEKARGYLREIFARHNVKVPDKLPDISTKELAQKFIGLDMKAIKEDKEGFLNSVVPEWDRKAQQRQGTLKKY